LLAAERNSRGSTMKKGAVLTKVEWDSIRAPIGKALTLPARAYTDEGILSAELSTVFRKNWMAVAYAHTVPEPGDARPIEVLGMPLLVVRGDDRRVRLFHNICPYDGCLVAMEPVTAARELEVLYHGWRYDLRGRLVAAPFWDGSPEGGSVALRGAKGDLVEIRSETRLGVVFADLGGKAGSIDRYLAPLREALAEYELDAVVPVEDDDGDLARNGRFLRTNWKTYLENAAINVLHEAFTHELYRNSGEVPRVKDGKKTHFTLAHGPLMALGYDIAYYAKTYNVDTTMPHLGRGGRAPKQGFFITYYPNLVIPIRQALYRVNICLPEAPDRTRILHCGFMHSKIREWSGFSGFRQKVAGGYKQVYAEDGRAVEAVQSARRSPVWQQHYYAPFWDAQHHHFNKLVAADLMSRPVSPRMKSHRR
jgi:choline monooxygenase